MKPGRPALILVSALVIVFNLLRFVRLDSNPVGYSSDESSNAIHMICLAETGADALGSRWPLFSNQFEPAKQHGRGMIPPTHLYLGALWSQVFGYSMASFRGLSAFFMVMAVLGIFLLTRLLAGTEAAAIAALSASISPWGFQVGRIFGMAALVPAFTVLALYFFLRSNRFRDLTVAGLLWVAALYSYPCARVQAPILLAATLALKWSRGDLQFKKLIIPGVIAIVFSIPLLQHSVSAASMDRASSISVFQKDFLTNEKIGDSKLGVALIVLENTLKHFSPDYLFITGDGNIRHSTRVVGELSWLDALALAAWLFLLVPLWLIERKARTPADGRPPPENPFKIGAVGFFLAAAIFSGILPAALTHEDVPHALRSVGAWTFAPMVFGILLQPVVARLGNVAWGAIALTSVLFAGYFFHYFFAKYPTAPDVHWRWDAERNDASLQAAKAQDWTYWTRLPDNYSDIATRYYLVEYGHEHCLSSIDRLQKIWRDPRRGRLESHP